jgi:hypothetical protein
MVNLPWRLPEEPDKKRAARVIFRDDGKHCAPPVPSASIPRHRGLLFQAAVFCEP